MRNISIFKHKMPEIEYKKCTSDRDLPWKQVLENTALPPLSLSISVLSRSCKRISAGIFQPGPSYHRRGRFYPITAVGAGENERQRGGQGNSGFTPGRTFAPSSGLTGWPDVAPPGTPNRPRRWGHRCAPRLNADNATAILRHVALTRRRFSAHRKILLK